MNYDALNCAWGAALRKLKGLKPPHAVSSTTTPALWIMKHKEQWAICVRSGNAFVPIEECPIKERVEMVQFLRPLHEAIIRAKEEFVPEVEAAIASVNEFLGLFGDD